MAFYSTRIYKKISAAMNIIAFLHVLFICFIICRIKNFQAEGIKPVFSAAYFLLKCICGSVIYIIYRDHFKLGDTFVFLHEADVFYNLLKGSPQLFIKTVFGFANPFPVTEMGGWFSNSYNSFYTDNKTIILYNVFIRCFSAGNPFVHVVWMNIPAYFGLLWIYRCIKNQTAVLNLKGADKYLVFIPFLLPGVLAWGSSLLKEPMMIFALGALLRSAQLYFKQKERKYLFQLAASVFLFLFIKPYLLLLLLPGLFSWMIFSKSKQWKPVFIFVCIYCGGLFELLIAGHFFPVLDIPARLFGEQLSNVRYAVYSGAKSLVDPVLFAPTILSFLKRIPEALSFAFFRPFFFEIKQWWIVPLAIEPLIILLLFFYQLMKKRIRADYFSPFVLLIFFAALFLLLILGYISTVLGTIVRLKMPALFLIAIALVSLAKVKEIKKEN